MTVAPNDSFELPLVGLIKQFGYPIEVYEDVKTEDGYFLTLYRIPHGKNQKSGEPKPVVLLIHGLLSNSADYVFVGPGRALALLLSDAGYDVWLPNSRGIRVSRKHTKFDAEKDEQYWMFSFHEMGMYDLPAVFNQIEKVTGLKTVVIITHSQGTIIPLVLLSEKPEYNSRINLIIGMNPAVIIPNLLSIPYRILNLTRYFLEIFLEKRGILEFPPSGVNNMVLAFKKCAQKNTYLQAIFVQFMYILHGKTPDQHVQEDIPVMMRYYPDTTSIIVLKHLGQLFRTGIFRKYDYGPEGNVKKYGTPDSPLYKLENVTCPAAFFCSSADLVVQPKDVSILCKTLPNCIAIHEMDNPAFGHGDFLYGKYAVKVAYPYIFDYLKQYAKAK